MRKGIKFFYLLNTIVGIFFALLSMSSNAAGDTLETHEYAVTATANWETMPRLGNDGVSDIVVFTRCDKLPDTSFGKGDIWFQRLASGAPVGAPVQVTSGPQDNQLNDVSGDYIVYTAYDSTTGMTGQIMLYQISTTLRYSIGSASIILEARIHGNKVVWREGGANAAQLMLYDLSWLGTVHVPDVIAGPIPPTYSFEIGDRFVVWSERGATSYDVAAYDIATGKTFTLTATSSTSETEISTSGAWIVWQAHDKGVAATRIVARNMDTGEERVVADNGAGSYHPTIDGDLIAYESNQPGNLDIFVYRISTGETFQITNDPADQYLDDVFGQSVAYVDQRTGNEDIYVSTLTFVHVPDPVLEVTGREDYFIPPSSEFTRYWLSVTNWDAIPDDLFEPAPDLPPCGLNTNASRTWVYIYSQDGTYMSGFCGLDSPEDLGNIWFSVPKGQAPPEYVYITLWDRKDNITYTSNLAWTNLLPKANAGTDQTGHRRKLVTLDGSGSSDPDGNVPLTYEWSFVSVPGDSLASLSDTTIVNPTFIPDINGDYVIQLIVTDSLGAVSKPETVTISTINSAPIAEAGPDQLLTAIGTTVNLNGDQSYDPDGDSITYQWTFFSKPTGSTASLIGANTAKPTFVADKYGSYEIQLLVSDPWTQSSPDTVTISFENIKPVANAGTGQSIEVGKTVTLNGSGSSDANGDPLTYTWALVSFPDGSLSSIADPTAEITTFVPDLPGTYVVQLIVNDGIVDSDPSTIQVQAVTKRTESIKAIQSVETVVISLNPNVFKNANMQNTLINKLNSVIANIEAGNYADALGQLQNDILGKTDGCATAGAPDKNDWIKDCKAQNQVYPLIIKAIDLVEDLI